MPTKKTLDQICTHTVRQNYRTPSISTLLIRYHINNVLIHMSSCVRVLKRMVDTVNTETVV